MRRIMVGLVFSGVLLSAAACGSTGGVEPAPGGAPASLTPEQLATKASCEAIGDVYTKNMGAFATSLSKVPASGDAARKEAQQKLTAFGSAILGATSSSTDAQMRADGKETAEHLRATAKSGAFFAKIKTTDDVSTVLGPTMKEWLAPVTHHCS